MEVKERRDPIKLNFSKLVNLRNWRYAVWIVIFIISIIWFIWSLKPIKWSLRCNLWMLCAQINKAFLRKKTNQIIYFLVMSSKANPMNSLILVWKKVKKQSSTSRMKNLKKASRSLSKWKESERTQWLG